MIPTLRSEFRKLLSIRSTYFVAGLVLALTAIFTYFGTAPQFTPPPDNCQTQVTTTKTKDGRNQTIYTDNCPTTNTVQENKTLPSDQMETNIESTAQGIAIFLAVMAVLVMAHEYRYNTITYTLTLARKRSQVLSSKLVIVSAYVVAVTLLATICSFAVTHLAVSVKGLSLPVQTVSWPAVIGRSLFYDLGFALFGLGMITVLRNMVAGFVTVFAAFTVDGILSGILSHYQKDPSRYLPFDALQRAVAHHPVDVAAPGSGPSPMRAATTYMIYLVALWVIAWVLFLRRDAN